MKMTLIAKSSSSHSQILMVMAFLNGTTVMIEPQRRCSARRRMSELCEEDPNCIINPIPDGDGDGVPEWEDCDDTDPNVGAPQEPSEPPPEDLACEEDPTCDIIVNPCPRCRPRRCTRMGRL